MVKETRENTGKPRSACSATPSEEKAFEPREFTFEYLSAEVAATSFFWSPRNTSLGAHVEAPQRDSVARPHTRAGAVVQFCVASVAGSWSVRFHMRDQRVQVKTIFRYHVYELEPISNLRMPGDHHSRCADPFLAKPQG